MGLCVCVCVGLRSGLQGCSEWHHPYTTYRLISSGKRSGHVLGSLMLQDLRLPALSRGKEKCPRGEGGVSGPLSGEQLSRIPLNTSHSHPHSQELKAGKPGVIASIREMRTALPGLQAFDPFPPLSPASQVLALCSDPCPHKPLTSSFGPHPTLSF